MNDSRDRQGSGSGGDGDERLDFSALDPTRDDAAFEARLRSIRVAARSELARRSGAPGLFDLFLGWRRPILAASTLLAAASLVVLFSAPTNTRSTSLAEAAGLSSSWAEWMGIVESSDSGAPEMKSSGGEATP